MNQEQIQAITAEIDQLQQESDSLHGIDAEHRLLSILKPLLEADGFEVEHTGGSRDKGIDYLARREEEPNEPPTILGIQYKHYRSGRRVGVDTVRQMAWACIANELSRAILLVNTGFSRAALATAEHELPTYVELCDLNFLRAWIARIKRSLLDSHSAIVLAIAELSRKLARLIATNPRGLDEIEWRDFERMLAVVFEKIGFKVELTPGSKDGGKDIILECVASGSRKSYLIEAKHWRCRKRVGKGLINEFVKVTANENRDGGLYLATYGYCSDAFEALTEMERKRVRFGEEEKVVALCQTYVRAESGLLLPQDLLPEVLFAGTV